MQISILNKLVDVDRRTDVTDGQWAIIEPRLRSFPTALQGVDLESLQRSVLMLTNGIVVFRRTQHNGYRMTRSFMDLERGLFHWHVDDLTHTGYRKAERVATYYYHDAFHVHQFQQGDTDQHIDALVAREVTATQAQIALGRLIGADKPFLDELSRYAADPAAIRERLNTGVGLFGRLLFGRPRYSDHFSVL